VAEAVRAVMASIELVDDRWDDFNALPMATLLADDFFGAGCVLGAELTNWRDLDLATLGGRMLINGTEAGAGIAGDILGHPLNALVWLADLRAKQGTPLKAGTFVTLGSLVKTVWVDKGDKIVAEIDGLEPATLVIE
jgi:2-oxo-3-hexenedioate decarboxylase/2-keto-4-pentenoate hydratase